MITTKTLLSLLLALSLCLALCACAAAEEPAFDAELPVRVMTLNGTTGFGMAKLMDDAAKDEASPYTVGVETDASNIAAALVSGECDIAALPTNAAAQSHWILSANSSSTAFPARIMDWL